jgi:hypothetical protein
VAYIAVDKGDQSPMHSPVSATRRSRPATVGLFLAIAIMSLALLPDRAAAAGFKRSPLSASADAASAAPSLLITGPQEVAPETEYSYTVTIVTARSYKRAAVWFYSLDCSQRRTINLVAHRPWQGSFTSRLSADQLREYPVVSATVVSPASRTPPYSRTLFRAELPLTVSSVPAPTASVPSSPRCEQIGD